jgi:Cu-processing system permease protein
MTTATIAAIARQELTINVRNKWTLLFSIIFGVLVLAISYFGIMAEGFSGMQNFTRTSASLLNLVLYIIPLAALIMGTMSFTGDKGTMELLFSQPISRAEIVLGKLLGVFTSLALSTLVGFSLAGSIILGASGTEGLLQYTALVAFSLILALIFVSLAFLVATVSKRKARAFGIALFVWFFFVLFYDLLAIGGTLLLKGASATIFLFLSLCGNPVDMVRVASLIVLDNATVFGPGGAALVRFFGGGAISIFILAGVLLLWAAIPFIVAAGVLRSQDI